MFGCILRLCPQNAIKSFKIAIAQLGASCLTLDPRLF